MGLAMSAIFGEPVECERHDRDEVGADILDKTDSFLSKGRVCPKSEKAARCRTALSEIRR